jgi:DNA-binding LacI/PurR family transcriptional regulator
MSGPPNAQSIADYLAEAGAGFVLIAPADCRDDVIDSLAEGFRDACIEHGIQIKDEDVAYYVKVVMGKVRELMPRMVEAELKAKQ